MLERATFEHELKALDLQATPREYSVRGETSPTPVRLTHYSVRKYIDPGSRALLSDARPSVMVPANMQPGYVPVAAAARQSLQSALSALVTRSYADSLAPLHLRLALVDLTEAKHHAPIFAGHEAFGPKGGVDGASLTKILALYALFQLRFDLNTVATLNNLTSPAALTSAIVKGWKKEGLHTVPDFGRLFRFVRITAAPITAEVKIDTDIHHNHVARALILALGFEYIGSVALQSGLYDPRHGGLWLNAAYGKPAVSWTTTPFPRLARHNATALSVATFFTLLAQGRLADQRTSNAIARVLKGTKCFDGGLLDGIHPLPGAVLPSANKCGLLKPAFHDAVLVERQVPGGRRLQYVIAVLTKWPPPLDFTRLGRELDGLVAAANP